MRIRNAYLGRLDLRPERSNLLLDLCLDLLDLELLLTRLLAHAALLEIEVETDAGLRARDLLAEALLELLDVCNEPVVLCLDHRELVLLHELELGFELREVDLLRVVVLYCQGW